MEYCGTTWPTPDSQDRPARLRRERMEAKERYRQEKRPNERPNEQEGAGEHKASKDELKNKKKKKKADDDGGTKGKRRTSRSKYHPIPIPAPLFVTKVRKPLKRLSSNEDARIDGLELSG